MILDALIAQFQQRFQHEKRAQVCLWFDDKGEFTPLLPALREHLSAMQPRHLSSWSMTLTPTMARSGSSIVYIPTWRRSGQRSVNASAMCFTCLCPRIALRHQMTMVRTTWSCSQNTVSPAFCGGWRGSGQRCLASCATPESSSQTTLRNSAGSMTGVAILYWPNTWPNSSTSRQPSGTLS